MFWQIKTKIVSCRTADSKPVKQEVNGTVILPPLVFPGDSIGKERESCNYFKTLHIEKLRKGKERTGKMYQKRIGKRKRKIRKRDRET